DLCWSPENEGQIHRINLRWPMKNSIKCPVCGRDFDPRTPVCHISKYHQSEKNCELEKIRDARRQYFKVTASEVR
ncbi:hypothetical protein H5960_24645, partial [Escherichia coli]|nr:hypothetical protein [Escherichia coli]